MIMEFSYISIDKLGKRLAINENDDDLNLLQEYRKTFDKPLQNVFSVIFIKKIIITENPLQITLKKKKGC